MAVALSKVMNLADGFEIYKDLRDRIKNLPIPEVPVEDVRVNGSSILNSGVADIPVAGPDRLGVLKVGSGSRGVAISSIDDELQINGATANTIKSGTNSYCPITPKYADAATFYGLAKAAGKTMSSVANATVGVYPDEQKQAIQKMFGLDGLFGDYQDGNLASRAYAVGETFIMDGKRYKVTAAISDGGLITVGTNCELDPITDPPIASSSALGLVKPLGNAGIYVTSQGNLCVDKASSGGLKAGTNAYNPVVPQLQHESVYYALAKLAGADMASLSGETVGVYPEAQKQAIQSMLGVSTGAILIENVSGGTPTLTCMPNVRYMCGEVSTLSITPPASGSCEVIFESGSTATLLTVPNTVKFPPWFDATALENGKIYDIIITDGVYGAVMSWAS